MKLRSSRGTRCLDVVDGSSTFSNPSRGGRYICTRVDRADIFLTYWAVVLRWVTPAAESDTSLAPR